MSRSKSSAGKSFEQQEKGKGKGKEKEKDEGGGRNGVADGAGNQEKMDRIVSLMNLRAAEVGAGTGMEKEKEEKQNEKVMPEVVEPDLLVPPPLSRTRSHSPSRSPSTPASVRSRHSRSLLNVETHKGGGTVEAGGDDAVGEDSDAVGNADVVGAGQLIDEQTAIKSRTGFAIFRVAEALVRGGLRTVCGTCFGYGDS